MKPEHPVVRDVPRTFEVVDELYYINAEAEKIPAGTAAIEVLAETSPSQRFKKPHPAVWITRHPTARVVGITLGHDEPRARARGVQGAAGECRAVGGPAGPVARSRYADVDRAAGRRMRLNVRICSAIARSAGSRSTELAP